MTIEDLKEKRISLGLSYQELADRSGVSLSSIQKIFGGINKNPRRKTLEELERVLCTDDKDHTDDRNKTDKKETGKYSVQSVGSGMVREALAYQADAGADIPRKKQGEYTLEDYYAWPEDQRIELIDGWIFEMNAPTGVHQIIAGNIYYKLVDYIRKHKGKCIPFIAPTDVRLNMDNRTMVQPDVFVICDRDKLGDMRRMEGAPDFIVEVLSKSTKKNDMYLKAAKYCDAGVREYWLVDYDRKRIIQHDYEGDDVVLYTFEDEVPVRIYDGKLKISFKEIGEYLEDLLQGTED